MPTAQITAFSPPSTIAVSMRSRRAVAFELRLPCGAIRLRSTGSRQGLHSQCELSTCRRGTKKREKSTPATRRARLLQQQRVHEEGRYPASSRTEEGGKGSLSALCQWRTNPKGDIAIS